MIGLEKIEHACLTDVGVRRSHNQDNHAVLLAGDEEQLRTRGHVFVVADGMGGHAVGELASQQAVATIPHIYHKHSQQGAVRALRVAYEEANSNIYSKGQRNREFEGMGTTATTLVLKPEGVWIAHVGDTRVYRIRNGTIEQLTYDHSLAWEIARQRKIGPENVQVPTNVLIRSLGPTAFVEVDVEGPHPVEPGDIFLLCSDGLSGQLNDHEIGAVAGVLAPAEACRFLVDLANMRGGPDNVTVLIVRAGTNGISHSETKDTASSSVPVPKPWFSVPWPLTALFSGIVLAALATWLTYLQTPFGLPAFIVAALVIIAGLVGLRFEQKREQREAEPKEEPKLQVYRSAACKIDRALVEKLARATQMLRQRAEEKQSEQDRWTFSKHFDQAELLLGRGELPNAFREYCRAMRSLVETVQRQNIKVEMFQPVWDK